MYIYTIRHTYNNIIYNINNKVEEMDLFGYIIFMRLNLG
jgi:hypothetical protein